MNAVQSRPPATGLAPAPGRLALASLALCMFLPSLGTSIANVALPTLTQAFAATFQQVQWVILAYLLASTTLIVSAGRLGDHHGRRRLLLGGILLFSAASLLCGLAPALGWLMAARAAQGLGAALMMSLSMALVSASVPEGHAGSAMGLLGTTSAIGTAMGPMIGGMLIAAFWWPAVFFVQVPLGILAALLAFRHLPNEHGAPSTGRSGFDVMGTVLLALVLAMYALSVTMGAGRFGPMNGALFLAALAGAGLFVYIESRAAFPLVRLAAFRDPGLSSGLLLSVLVTTVMMATLVAGPFYLAIGLGLDAVGVGLVLSAGPMAAALAGVPGGRLVDRLGAQRMTTAGLLVIAAGSIALAIVAGRFGVPGYLASIVVITAGYALFQAANNTAFMSGARPDQRGVFAGLLNLSRNLGLITGASVMGAVFQRASSTTDMATARPEAVATGMQVTFALAALLTVAALLMALGGRRLAARMLATAETAPLPGTP